MRFYVAGSRVTLPTRDPIACDDVSIEPRRWDVAIFSWAYLATNQPHLLRVPYQLADVLSSAVHLEFVLEAPDFPAAARKFELLYMGLLAEGIVPFSTPYIGTHSINAISALGVPTVPPDERADLSAALRDGTEAYEARWYRPDLRDYSAGPNTRKVIEADDLVRACDFARRWEKIEERTSEAVALRRAFTSAPSVLPPSMGFLSIWTALEGLFPDTRSEITYRLSLGLAQMCAVDTASLDDVKRLRKLYGRRSRVAHGDDASEQDWEQAWEVFRDVVRAIVRRGTIPSEDELLAEVLLGDEGREPPTS